MLSLANLTLQSSSALDQWRIEEEIVQIEEFEALAVFLVFLSSVNGTTNAVQN